ncbi:hypothetical protein IJ531_05725 [bacterium]|nr:hypothetical protein [bacterium]
MDKNIVVLRYQDSFADNFSTFAYGKIIEEKFALKCFYENITSKRQDFEEKMQSFNIKADFISKSRTDKIAKKQEYFTSRDIKSKKITKDKLLDINCFNLDDTEFLTKEIKNIFEFKNLDFIQNYDVLEEITTFNSIGLYINQNDEIDYNYVQKSAKRLNKYLKKPILYIFSKKELNLELDIEYKTLNIADFREEFYFLKNCKHKIILNSKNSYSEGFWAAILANKSYYYTVFDKNIKHTKKLKNWLFV